MKTKKCPVCDWEIKDAGKLVKIKGAEVIVCCEDCAQKVKADPQKYLGRVSH
jgi:ribosome-binding protein aMBF1 (putative translation factor)